MYTEKALQNTITEAKRTFESDLINTYASANNNNIFKSITKSNNIPSVMNLESLTDYSIDNLLNQYFQAVFHDSSFSPNIDYQCIYTRFS